MFHAKLKETSNQSDWSMPISFMDRASGSLIDLTGDTFQLAVTPVGPPPDASRRGWYDRGYGYGPAWSPRAPILVGSTATRELQIIGLGMLLVYFPVTRMQSLPPGMYKVGITVSNGALTAQLLLGYLPVRDGIVMPALAQASA